MIWSAFKIEYERNYMNMEPKGLTSIALSDAINEKFDLSMEYALCLTDDVEESRELAKQFRDLGTVSMTEDISAYLPSAQERQERISFIREIEKQMLGSRIKSKIFQSDLAKFSEEIDRLEMNVMEMQDMAFLGGQDKVDYKCKQLVGDPEKTNSLSIFQDLLVVLNEDEQRAAKGLTHLQNIFAPYFQSSVLKIAARDGRDAILLTLLIMARFSQY